MRTLLITAYAVNPYKGSEDATGWNWIKEIAKQHKVIAITSKNNKENIDKFLKSTTDTAFQNIQFEYFDLPKWARFWKVGEYTSLIYYYLWQFFIPFFILSKKFVYDYAHHLNFHNDWTPSFLWLLRKPFLWGPIGHHPKIEKAYKFQAYSNGAYKSNAIRWLLKQAFWTFDPFLKITKFTASHIFVMHQSVAENLNIDKSKYTVVPAIAANEPSDAQVKVESNTFNVISIGRFIPLKGFDLTINAFAKFHNLLEPNNRDNVKLTIVGKGKHENDLKQLVNKLNVSSYVDFVNWMPREELNALYQNSSCLFFPSHEGAGMVVLEALSYGLPVLCFDNVGPGAFITNESGTKIKYSNYNASVKMFAHELKLWFDNKELLKEKSENARNLFKQKYIWNKKLAAINVAIEKIDIKNAENSLHPSIQ